MNDEEMIEIRCPVGPRRLLFRMQPLKPHITPGNLIELSCSDCTRETRKKKPDTLRVVHRFDLLGDLVESVRQVRE